MKKLNVLFQMDPLKRLNQDIDSTCKIAREAILRGHQVFFTEAKNVYFLINKVFVKCSYFLLEKLPVGAVDGLSNIFNKRFENDDCDTSRPLLVVGLEEKDRFLFLLL